MNLREGESALLIDSKGRHFLLKLESGRTFRFHNGQIPHDELIGAGDGTWVTTTGHVRMLLIRPRLADFILKMKRGAQVVYPKDLGPILVYADIGPGMTVLEAGTGSGALTLGLARAVGPSGKVITVERRDDHATHARKTLTRWFGELPDNVEMRIGDVADHVADVRPERIVLDLPEPWHTLEAAASHQPNGGVVAAYVPTVPQIQTTVEKAKALRTFAEIEVNEFMMREWNVNGRSVRPAHTMVGHTGFLIFMRKVSDETERSNSDN
ncbi:MAG TPA: tRNA (adenine-N1)-methyltransferase [Acidimicrobiia bacterium]|jgi:tRNA (adenine57-N1/adenine58-N1)-methyltransferase|nr:tRNA (adenine-N1)-methyltransferase [Acidimicrobiia bacterium]